MTDTWQPPPKGGFLPGDVFISYPSGRTVVTRNGSVVWDVGIKEPEDTDDPIIVTSLPHSSTKHKPIA